MAEKNNTSDASEERRKWVKRRYWERSLAPDGGLNKWRTVIFKEKLIDSYRDKEFIRTIFTRPIASALPDQKCMIGDFASAFGLVGKAVVEQLERPKERRVLPIGIDNFRKDFWQGEKPKPDIKTIHSDLRQIRVEADAFDAGILRFALPFIPKDDQPEVLKQIYRVLKPGAVLVVLNDGVFKEAEADKAWTALFTESARSEGLVEMHYPSCENVEIMAKKAGFRVTHAQDLTEIAVGYLSPEICVQVVKPELQAVELTKMNTLFTAWKEKDPDSFEPQAFSPKSLRVPWPMYTCVLKK